jgi:hypothetical protein
MNQRLLVSFGSAGYERGLHRLAASATPYFNKILLYNEDSLKIFREANPHLFTPESKGYGWWAWKPYIILSTLIEHPGSTIMYTDALCEFVNDPSPLFTSSPITLFDQSVSGHKEIEYTKPDVLNFYRMFGKIDPLKPQMTASFQIYRHSAAAIDFLKEYYLACTNLHLVSESQICIPSQEFKAHRHDQSILGMLSQIHSENITVLQDPSQWGITDIQSMGRRGYNQIINHHRTK